MTKKLFGQTAELVATTGTEDIFTPVQGRHYILTVWASDDANNYFWTGKVMSLSSSTLRIGPDLEDGARTSVADNSGAIQVQNISGSNKTFNWSLVEIS